MVSRCSKISFCGYLLVIAAALYLFMPIYSANVTNFTFTCNIVTMAIKGGFVDASFIDFVRYLLPFGLLLASGLLAVGGKLKNKYIVFGLACGAVASLLWVMIDVSLVESLLEKLDFGSVVVKDGLGTGVIVCILVAIYSAVTVFFAKGRQTF